MELAIKFAEQEFTLSKRQKDGNTLREHLLLVEKQTKRTPKELQDLVELPRHMLEVWNWFAELNSTRPVGMAVGAITYTEIKNYFDLMGIDVSPEEVQLIKLFDRIAMKHSEQEQKAEQSTAKSKK
jgi:hypothetical protein